MSNKPIGDTIQPILWERIKRDVLARASDPRAVTEVGRLAMNRELTSLHVVTAFKIAEVYGAFERLEGINRSCRSASYQTGRGQGGVDEDRLSKEELSDLIEAQDGIREAFLSLSEEMMKYPKWMRDVIEQLCVEDRAILPIHFTNVRTMLDNLAGHFKKKRAALRKPRGNVVHLAREMAR